MRKARSKRSFVRAEKKRSRPNIDEQIAHKAAESILRDDKPNLLKTDGWLTRSEAIDLLHCSPTTIKNYEERGKLHPQQALRRDSAGTERVMLVYSPKELAELPPRTYLQPSARVREPGEQASAVFRMLREGRPLDDIVIDLCETPDRIDYLNERWMAQTNARHVITPKAYEAFEQLVGPFSDVTGLFNLVAAKLARCTCAVPTTPMGATGPTGIP